MTKGPIFARLVSILAGALLPLVLIFLGMPLGAQESEPERRLIVVNEGHASCMTPQSPYGHVMEQRASEIAKQLKRRYGIESDLMLSCFRDDYHSLLFTKPGSHYPERASSQEEYFRSVRDQYRRGAYDAMHIIGHSHGGWLAMKTVLAMPRDVVILTLDTIDAISWILCSPEVVARATLRSWFRPRRPRPDPGCTESAADLKPYFGDISRRVGQWENYYQEQFSLIQASPIAAADGNYRRAFFMESAYDSSPHIRIYSDPFVWERIAAKILPRGERGW